jgi:outer membrane lipoprotein-sorting protein
MRRVLLVAAVLLWTAAFSGCCGYVRTYHAPVPGNLLSTVNRLNRKTRSLRAKAKADQFTSKGRVKLTVFLLVERPGKLRFEATVLDNTVAILTSDGSNFASIDFKKHVAYRGPASPCNIARIFRIPLSPEHVGVVMMGGVPVLRHDSVRVSWDKCTGAEVLTLKNTGSKLTQKIYLKRRKGMWQITGSKIYDGRGRKLVSLKFKRFKRKGGRWVPHLIHFVMRKPYTDVLIRFDKLVVNIDIPQKAFTLEPPSKLPERWLTCPPVKQLPFLPVAAAKPAPSATRPAQRAEPRPSPPAPRPAPRAEPRPSPPAPRPAPRAEPRPSPSAPRPATRPAR